MVTIEAIEYKVEYSFVFKNNSQLIRKCC